MKLQDWLEKKVEMSFEAVIPAYAGIYPLLAIGPLAAASIPRYIAWNSDTLFVFSGVARVVVKEPLTALEIQIPSESGRFFRLMLGSRRYWVRRQDHSALQQLVSSTR